MKNKKTFVGIALLILVLVLGIGYAAISKNLTIDGSATVTATNDNFKVAFTGETSVTGTDLATASATKGAIEGTLSVTGLKKAGDEVTAKYEVDNQSNGLNANLAVSHEVKNDTEHYFSVTSSVEDSSIAVGDTTNVVVTVKLLKTPVENQTADIDVTLVATADVANTASN